MHSDWFCLAYLIHSRDILCRLRFAPLYWLQRPLQEMCFHDVSAVSIEKHHQAEICDCNKWFVWVRRAVWVWEPTKMGQMLEICAAFLCQWLWITEWWLCVCVCGCSGSFPPSLLLFLFFSFGCTTFHFKSLSFPSSSRLTCMSEFLPLLFLWCLRCVQYHDHTQASFQNLTHTTRNNSNT